MSAPRVEFPAAGRIHFTPEYLAANGGAIAGIEAPSAEPNYADSVAARITPNTLYYEGAHLSVGAKLHPRGYKVPAPRKCDGTMLVRPAGASESVRVPLPLHLRADAGAKKPRATMPKVHPLGYAMPKGRKDDGTMLVRVNGPHAPAVRIRTPDNFRVVHFDRKEREPLSTTRYNCSVTEAAYAEHYARTSAVNA